MVAAIFFPRFFFGPGAPALSLSPSPNRLLPFFPRPGAQRVCTNLKNVNPWRSKTEARRRSSFGLSSFFRKNKRNRVRLPAKFMARRGVPPVLPCDPESFVCLSRRYWGVVALYKPRRKIGEQRDRVWTNRIREQRV